jgi:hypothetical protein
MVLAGVFLKAYAVLLVATVAIGGLLLATWKATGEDEVITVLMLTAGVAVILVSAVTINVLKKKF